MADWRAAEEEVDEQDAHARLCVPRERTTLPNQADGQGSKDWDLGQTEDR